jgi:hypothetical protein
MISFGVKSYGLTPFHRSSPSHKKRKESVDKCGIEIIPRINVKIVNPIK